MALLRSGTRIYGNATIDTVLEVNGTDAATSNATGALKVVGGIGVKGNIFTSANVTALNADLGNLATANYFEGIVLTADQPNITSLGELTSLTVSGNTILNGNLVVNGTTTTVDSDNSVYKDSIIELHKSDTPQTVDDGKDVGIRVHYFDSVEREAFFGVSNDSKEFEYYVDGSETDGVFSGTYGNIKALTFISNASGSIPPFVVSSSIQVDNLKAEYSGSADTSNFANLAATVSTNAQPNITSVGTLSSLTVTGLKTFGAPSTIKITGGLSGYVLQTDGSGNLSWAAPSTGTGTGDANVGGSDKQVQFNDGGSYTLGASANFTFDKSSNTLTVDAIIANGSQLTYLTGSNVVGNVGNASHAYVADSANSVAGANVSGAVSYATTANSVAGANVSGAVSYATTANSVAGANVSGAVSYATTANSVAGANVSGQVANALVAGTVYTAAQPNITSLGTLTSVAVSGNITSGNANLGNAATANYFIGDGSLLTGIPASAIAANFHACVIANVNTIVAGSTLSIAADYSNATYPAGIFTINQLGPVSITTTDTWASGSTSKNAYANYISSSINTQNISIVLSVANATFDIKTTDTITIGGSSVTGANITALGISGTGGTYTIPNTYFSSTVQTSASDTVTVNLTTNRGVYASTGTTLTNNQPVPFNVTALTGSFPTSSVPYWSVNQTFTWSATTSSGATVASGNVTYANVANSISGSLTSSGATSGTSTSLDSTMAYTISSTDYTGAGQYGAGTRTIPSTVTGTVSAATKYYPLFWKITSSSTVPTLTTSDSHNSSNYALGQGATTSTTATDYLWIATPTSASHTFKHVFLGSDIVDTPDVTDTTTISGQTYKVWGFTNFSQAASIVTTS
jgi:hypothetical protein